MSEEIKGCRLEVSIWSEVSQLRDDFLACAEKLKLSDHTKMVLRSINSGIFLALVRGVGCVKLTPIPSCDIVKCLGRPCGGFELLSLKVGSPTEEILEEFKLLDLNFEIRWFPRSESDLTPVAYFCTDLGYLVGKIKKKS